MRLRDLARAHVFYGCQRLHILLRREGWRINHKKTYRLYTDENLQMRTKKPRRRRAAVQRVARPRAMARDQAWSMDFISDALADSRRFRALTIVDHYSRESVAIEVGKSMSGCRVVEVLRALNRAGRRPECITVDNGSEFISKVLDQWAHWHKVQLDFIRPGKPVENAYIEWHRTMAARSALRRCQGGHHDQELANVCWDRSSQERHSSVCSRRRR